ncbi:Capsular polysaccharide export system periplasmic protein KpsD [Escherichia coli O5:K4(L):H4 str. ATCC 23502]|nr:Capsular polysaccharide export system periplasmic protein KpsD [Escherichia coli O5:K4(L):H4 str. ATCC 23502]
MALIAGIPSSSVCLRSSAHTRGISTILYQLAVGAKVILSL